MEALRNSFTFKEFQIDILFQFENKNGQNILFANSPTAFVPPGGFMSGYSNQPTSILDRWRKPGDRASLARSSTTSYSYSYALNSNAAFSDASA